jgi:hypothetical protein
VGFSVRSAESGAKHFHHPDVDEIHLNFNRLDLAGDRGLALFTYATEPGSRSEEALQLLGNRLGLRRAPSAAQARRSGSGWGSLGRAGRHLTG